MDRGRSKTPGPQLVRRVHDMTGRVEQTRYFISFHQPLESLVVRTEKCAGTIHFTETPSSS